MPYTLERCTKPGRDYQWAAVNDDTGETVYSDANKKAVEATVNALNEQEKAWALAHGLEPPPPPKPTRTALYVVYDVLFNLLKEDLLTTIRGTDATEVEIENVLILIEQGENLDDPVSHRKIRGNRKPVKQPKDK